MKTNNLLWFPVKAKYLLPVMLLCITFITACIESQKVSKDPVETIENLKIAVNTELSSAAAYKAYSNKALQEGYNNISKAFDDISLAKTVHARVYKNILTKRNVNTDDKIDDVSVGNTINNLKEAISFEESKYSDYLEYVNIARKENCAEAETAFRWACDTEKKHKTRFNELLNSIANK
jgi:rubrerythrin